MSISHSVEETHKIAENFVRHIRSLPIGKNAIIIGLRGNLGSGKTTFAKAFGNIIGIVEDITSPTFVIEKVYRLDLDARFNEFVHIDAYRLSSGKEMESLGWDNLINEPKRLIFIEWPENIKDILPKETIYINFETLSEGDRKIDIFI